jgi:very-short-patch-repair endonuclease
MRFRSIAEIKVAQALEERGLLYCPNSLTRLGNYHKSFEVDFLVCCPTRWGFRWAILEVDGYWHKPQKRAKEHERERLFEHSGIRVHRFDATLCEIDPHAVVSELMNLMSH